MSIQRYAAYWVNGAFELNPRDDGEYVRFAEHMQTVTDLLFALTGKSEQIVALNRELERVRESNEQIVNRLNDANTKRSMLIDENSELRSRIAMMRAR